MGKSPSIQDLEAKEDAFRAYLQKLETELQQKSAAVGQQVQTEVNKFYTDNKYTDAKDLVSGQNFDFVHQQEFSLANMKTIVDAISKAVFAGGSSPSGASVDGTGAKAAADALGPEVGQIANLELYIAGQVFDVLSNIILSFGTSTSVTFNTDLQSKSLGYGLQMFTAVSADSYQSTSFFNNDYIYEYLYLYEVKFSVQQAQAETKQTLVELYEDQIVTFKQREEALLSQLESGSLTVEAYTSTNAAYDALIAASEAKLAALKTQAAATRRLSGARGVLTNVNLVVSIENATTGTPILSAINLNNANWVVTQDLTVGQSIANGATIVGILDANLPFSGSIRLHYTYDGATKGPVDVDFTFDGSQLDGQPLIGCAAVCTPNTAFTNTDWRVREENGDYYLMLKVQ